MLVRGQRGGRQQQPYRGGQRPQAQAVVQAVAAHEAQEAEGVVAGNLLVCGKYGRVLFDSGATHSFISTSFVKKHSLPRQPMHVMMCVRTPTRVVSNANEECLGCPIVIGGVTFWVDLVILDMNYFDVILGMNWLSKWKSNIDCGRKRIVLQVPGLPNVIFEGESKGGIPKLVSTMKAVKFMRKGCVAFLTSVVVNNVESKRLEDISVVEEYPDVFPDELPGLPPEREVEFAIELQPGVQPISKAPYRMAPAEMAELKEQLQELLDKGFIRPSVSPWGAPVLFVKKKDGSLRLCIDYWGVE